MAEIAETVLLNRGNYDKVMADHRQEIAKNQALEKRLLEIEKKS